MCTQSSKDYSCIKYREPVTRRFPDNKKVTKSHILAMNTPVKINVPEGQLTNTIANQSETCLKCERPVGTKDMIPRKRRLQ